MRKVILFLSILFSMFSFSQTNNVSYQIQKDPLSKNTDVNVSKGIPQISIPLFDVPTLSKSTDISLSLSFLTSDVSSQNMVSDIGLGWRLDKEGYISRVTQNFPEDYLINQLGNKKRASSNVYEYNFLGKSGKFTIEYDNDLHDIRVQKLYPSKEKIIFEKTTDTTQYKINSFTIIDESGTKFLFDKKDISFMTNADDVLSGNTAIKKLYHSIFYLSKITDPHNNILANYEYETTIQKLDAVKKVEQNKLMKIDIPKIGSIHFEYLKAPLNENWNLNSHDKDNYELQKIILKDLNSSVQKQYSIGRTSWDRIGSLNLLDRNNNIIEKYSFLYDLGPTSNGFTSNDIYGYPNNFSTSCGVVFPLETMRNKESVNPEARQYTLTIISPTGGRTDYEFEANTVEVTPYLCEMGSCYDNFEVVKLVDLNFDDDQNQHLYPLNIDYSQYGSRFYIEVEHDFHDQGIHPSDNFDFRFEYGNNNPPNFLNVGDYATGTPGDDFQNYSNNQCLSKNSFTNGNGIPIIFRPIGYRVFGNLKIYGTKKLSRNFAYANGERIKKVKRYKDNNSTPFQVLKYDYSDFNGSNISSGRTMEIYSGSEYIGESASKINEVVEYKNVKITDSLKSTYTKYIFFNELEIDSLLGTNNNMASNFDLNGSIKDMGLMKKMEQYGANTVLYGANEFTYDLNYKIESGILDNFSNNIKTPWIKNQKIISKSRINANKILQNTKEMSFEPKYANLTNEKATDFSGVISETKVFYPDDIPNNQKLINANMIGVPLSSETTKTENNITKIMAKTEAKYEDPNHFMKTSETFYDLTNSLQQVAATYNKYDNLDNILQVTPKNGIPVTTIWGYNQTQPIAVISGIGYDQLMQLFGLPTTSTGYLGLDIVQKSDADAMNPNNEATLLTALENFRNNTALKNYPITLFTYDPLVGVTNTILPNGTREINQYDSANRLYKVVDMNGKVLKEFQYNHKP